MGALRRRPGRVIAIAAIVALLGGFAMLADEVTEQGTVAIDQSTLQALRSTDGTPIGPAWVERTMLNLSALGSAAVATLIVVIASLFLFFSRRPRQALLVIGCAVGTAILINVLKETFARERPTIVSHLDVLVSGLSFPSGHSMIASALYPTLGIVLAANLQHPRLKVFVFVTAAVLALLIGFTRVYLGVHYPTDVVGGWLLGLAWALVLGIVSQSLQKSGVVEPPAPPPDAGDPGDAGGTGAGS